MLAFAIAASFTTLPDAIDWSKASDNLRFASLKPVMTEAEVQRLRVGKQSDFIGCGSGTVKDGNTLSGCDLGYVFKLTGRKEPLCIHFDLIGQAVKELQPADPWASSWSGWGQDRSPPPKPVLWTLVSFEVEAGATYKRNEDGLYVAEPKR